MTSRLGRENREPFFTVQPRGPSTMYSTIIAAPVIVQYTAMTKYRNFETNIPTKGISGLSPSFHIHASVSDLYIPTIGMPVLLEEKCKPILGLYQSLTDT